MEYLPVLFRFLHIVSAVVLVGGVIGWLYTLVPGLAALSPEVRAKAESAAAASWRPVVLTTIALILISGTYNFLHKTGLTPAWHAVFGIKALLALHVFAVAAIATGQGSTRRARQLTGVAISGVIVILLSAVLRYLSTQ
jgi:hypothetical protein